MIVNAKDKSNKFYANFVFMKYLKRSVKYFFYYVILLVIIIALLVAFKIVEADLSKMFVNGYDSLWQIALVFAAMAAAYPHFGFSKREVTIGGDNSEIIPGVKDVMEDHGYKLAEEDADGNMKFRKRAPLTRMLKMGEDALTFTRTATGYEIEGITKDLVRVVSALEYKFRTEE